MIHFKYMKYFVPGEGLDSHYIEQIKLRKVNTKCNDIKIRGYEISLVAYISIFQPNEAD